MPTAAINVRCPHCKKPMNGSKEEQPQEMDTKEVDKWKNQTACPSCGKAVKADVGYGVVYFKTK